MLLGFKTQIKVKQSQLEILAKHAGTARHAWNQGLALCREVLAYNREHPDDKIKFPTAIDLHKWLVASVKVEYPWYYEVSKCVGQYALRHLSNAFKDLFRKAKGFPRFKKKGRNDSFTLDGSITIDHQRIKVPVIGWFNTYERLPQGIKPKSVTISRQADRWFISFKIEGEPQITPKAIDAVGVDLGLLRFATLSTSDEIDSPRPYKTLEKQLAKLQWRNRNKALHSNNWKKAQLKIAKLHTRIGNIRKDFIHKLTTKLAKNHSKIVIEDLNVSGMIKNGKLSKAISDSGFYEFRRQLEYKTQLSGSELVLADRWFPSSKTCFNCQRVKDKLPLSVRLFECDCGWNCDRDLNASYNLVRLVQSDFMPVDWKAPKPQVEAGSFC